MVRDEIILEKYAFKLTAGIELEIDKCGIPLEYNPAERYENKRSLKLNAYGDKPFCQFTLKPYGLADLSIYQPGVYAIAGAYVKYIGKTNVSLHQRFNGYGSIQPRNCYEGGQSTNCRINHNVLEDVKTGEALWVYFHETREPDHVEAYLLNFLVATGLRPYWNKSIPSQVSKRGRYKRLMNTANDHNKK